MIELTVENTDITRDARTAICDPCPRRKTTATGLVGAIAPNLKFPLELGVIEGLQQGLEEANLELILWSSEGNSRTEAGYLQRALDYGVSGLVLWPYLSSGNQAMLRQLIDRGIPVVMCDRPYPEAAGPVVMPDYYGGMRRAVEHLIGLGHRRIGFVTSAPAHRRTVEAVRDRERAYLDAMAAADLLIKRMNGEKIPQDRFIIPAPLVIRSSTGGVKEKNK